VSWLYDPSIDPLAFEAFVYRITALETGRQYIGCKVLKSTRKGKRSESDWRSYWGSCEPLKDDVKRLGASHFKREIISFHARRIDARYHEEKLQFAEDVLNATLPDGSPAFWNRNIGRRHFAKGPKPKTARDLYRLDPKICQCGKAISFAKRESSFCTIRCSTRKRPI
jgi:hypothetical protein